MKGVVIYGKHTDKANTDSLVMEFAQSGDVYGEILRLQ